MSAENQPPIGCSLIGCGVCFLVPIFFCWLMLGAVSHGFALRCAIVAGVLVVLGLLALAVEYFS